MRGFSYSGMGNYYFEAKDLAVSRSGIWLSRSMVEHVLGNIVLHSMQG